jgi:uncharacterized protein YbaR (Trm112 family)
MRLLTHNQLICVRKNCPNSYPLQLKPEKVEQEETECREEFIQHILPTVDYSVLRQAAKSLGLESQLPLELPSELQSQQQISVLTVSATKDKTAAIDAAQSAKSTSEEDATMKTDNQTSKAETSKEFSHEDLMQNLHTLLMDTIVIQGELHCSGCKRVYRVQQGIPNMRLNEDEV